MKLLRTIESVGSALTRAVRKVEDAAFTASDLGAVEASLAPHLPQVPPVEPEIPWRSITRAMRESPNLLDRRQLLLGFEATTRALVWLPIEALWAHGYISGASDAGKTSRTLLPLALQIIACDPPKHRAAPDVRYRGPVLVIDLKGEPYFFHALRRAARDAGRPFRFFTNHPGNLTCAFNPILNLRGLGLSAQEIRDHIRLGMNIEYGAEYGEAHFAALNREEFDLLIEEHPDAESFLEFSSLLRGPNDPGKTKRWEASRREQSVSLRMAIKDLARIRGLNVTAKSEDQTLWAESIRMDRSFRDDDVLYFFLRQRPQETVARIIGALAIECFYAACRSYNQDGARGADEPAKHGYVIVDEFQNIAGRNFDGFMETARSAGLSLLLASQSHEKLEQLGIAHAVEHSTGFRQFYSAASPRALAYLENLSGSTEQMRETLSPLGERMPQLATAARFGVNDLNAIDAEPGFSVIRIRNRDYAQYDGAPVAIYAPYAMTRLELREFEAEAWPKDLPGLLSNEDLLSGSAEVPPVTAQQGPSTPEPPLRQLPPEDTELARAFARITMTETGYPFDPEEFP